MVGALRSQIRDSLAIGLMITASHNPEPDNGVKLIDPAGEMLEISWEAIATKLSNCSDEDVEKEIETICSQLKVDPTKSSVLVIGRDTRYIFTE